MPAYHHTSHFFLTTDDFEIFWQTWQPQGDVQRVLVLQHGIGEHSGRYQSLIKTLTESSIAVYALEARGHGRTQGIRGHVNNFAVYRQDLAEFIAMVRYQHEQAPVFLLGHSLGGAIALAYALHQDDQKHLRGLILSSPAIEIPLNFSTRIKKQMASLLVGIAPSLTMPTNINLRYLSHNPAVGIDYQRDPLTHGQISVALGHALFQLSKYFYAHAPYLRVPTYIFHGTGDKITSPEGSKKLYHLLRQSDKTLKLYDGLYHETLHEKEPDQSRVLHDLKQWILAH